MDFDGMSSKLERELLVGLVFNPGITLDVTPHLKTWDFGNDTCSDIYQTIVRLKKEEKDIDEDIRMKVTKKENILLVGFLGIIYGS